MGSPLTEFTAISMTLSPPRDLVFCFYSLQVHSTPLHSNTFSISHLTLLFISYSVVSVFLSYTPILPQVYNLVYPISSSLSCKDIIYQSRMAQPEKPGIADKLKSTILGCLNKSNTVDDSDKASRPSPTNMPLTKVNILKNPNYKANGTKSYVWLLHKYSFNPTLAGPYHRGNKIEQQGKHFPNSQHPIGGKARVRSVLRKTAADGQPGEVDFAYLEFSDKFLY